MKQIKQIFFLLLITGVIGGCKQATPPTALPPKTVQDIARFPVRIHSFSTGGTDITVIFDKDKTLLIDCSPSRDADLIAAYLKVHGVSREDYVLLDGDPYPALSKGEIRALGAIGDGVQPILPDTGITLNESRVRFATSDTGTCTVILHYIGAPISFPLQVSEPSSASPEAATVMVQNPSPDGRHTELYFEPLKEIIETHCL